MTSLNDLEMPLGVLHPLLSGPRGTGCCLYLLVLSGAKKKKKMEQDMLWALAGWVLPCRDRAVGQPQHTWLLAFSQPLCPGDQAGCGRGACWEVLMSFAGTETRTGPSLMRHFCSTLNNLENVFSSFCVSFCESMQSQEKGNILIIWKRVWSGAF